MNNKPIKKKPVSEMAVDYDPKYPERMHPNIQGDIEQGKNLYGQHPSFPGDKQKFAELIASEEFKKNLQLIRRYSPNVKDARSLGMMMMELIGKIAQIESGKEKELEQLAIGIVKEYFKIGNEVEFDAKIVGMKQQLNAGMVKIKQQEDEVAIKTAEEIADLDLEVSKRRFINGLIQGSAKRGTYLFHMVDKELKAIHPELVNMYGIVMSMGDLGYWIFDMNLAGGEGGEGEMEGQAGDERVDTSGKIPKVIARAVNFPVLVHELVKGTMELVALQGLPSDKQKAKAVLSKADFLNAENWDLRFGPGLWDKFTEAIDANDFDVKAHLFSKLVQMPAAEFHSFMQELLSGSKEGKQQLLQLAKDIKDQMKKWDADDAIKAAKKSLDNIGGDDDGLGDIDISQLTDLLKESASTKISRMRAMLREKWEIYNMPVKEDPRRYQGIGKKKLEEDAEARRSYVMKQFPDWKMRQIDDVMQADPTETKEYTFWIATQVKKNLLRLPEDTEIVSKALYEFNRLKNTRQWKEKQFPNDINKFEYQGLVKATNEIGGVDTKAGSKNLKLHKNSKIVLNKSGWTVVEINEYDALQYYCQSSSLCTNIEKNAKDYIGKSLNLYLFIKDGSRFGLYDIRSDQFHDFNNNDIDVNATPELKTIVVEAFKKIIRSLSNEEIINIAQRFELEDDEYFGQFLGKDARYLLNKARKKNERLSVEEESIILKSTVVNAINYTKAVIKGRWPMLEKVIENKNDASGALDYVKSILLETRTKYEWEYFIDQYIDRIHDPFSNYTGESVFAYFKLIGGIPKRAFNELKDSFEDMPKNALNYFKYYINSSATQTGQFKESPEIEEYLKDDIKLHNEYLKLIGKEDTTNKNTDKEKINGLISELKRYAKNGGIQKRKALRYLSDVFAYSVVGKDSYSSKKLEKGEKLDEAINYITEKISHLLEFKETRMVGEYTDYTKLTKDPNYFDTVDQVLVEDIPNIDPKIIMMVSKLVSKKKTITLIEFEIDLSFKILHLYFVNSVLDDDYEGGGLMESKKGELKKGFKVEKEHSKSLLKNAKKKLTKKDVKRITKGIAKDHIKELPDYYTRLKKMEKKHGKK